jgi:hypothetical protein
MKESCQTEPQIADTKRQEDPCPEAMRLTNGYWFEAGTAGRRWLPQPVDLDSLADQSSRSSKHWNHSAINLCQAALTD